MSIPTTVPAKAIDESSCESGRSEGRSQLRLASSTPFEAKVLLTVRVRDLLGVKVSGEDRVYRSDQGRGRKRGKEVSDRRACFRLELESKEGKGQARTHPIAAF